MSDRISLFLESPMEFLLKQKFSISAKKQTLFTTSSTQRCFRQEQDLLSAIAWKCFSRRRVSEKFIEISSFPPTRLSQNMEKPGCMFWRMALRDTRLSPCLRRMRSMQASRGSWSGKRLSQKGRRMYLMERSWNRNRHYSFFLNFRENL